MAQRYSTPLAHERMAANTCPECGEVASLHLDSPAFWLPRRCDLMPAGVVDRIEQYQADAGVSQ